MSLSQCRNLVFFCLLTFASSVQAGPFGWVKKQVNKVFYNSEPTLEVPLSAINDPINKNRWLKPSVGFELQFMNHPEDPDYYLRRESLALRLDIPVNLQGQLSVLAGPSVKSQFIRPFKKEDLHEVAGKLFSEDHPYKPSDAPHSHSKALNVLKTGEYYSFTTQMGLQISPNLASPLGLAFLGTSVNLRYILSGEFKVDVYRLSGSRVKVIASSLRKKSVGAGVSARVIPDLEVFGFDLLNDVVNNQLDVTLLDWDIYTKSNGHLFSVSYTLDLSKPAGQQAYDNLVNSVTWNKVGLRLKSHARSAKDPDRSFWMGDLAAVQEAAENNADGVGYNDESEMEYQQIQRGLRLDFLIADRSSQRHFMEIDYRYKPSPTAADEYYRIASMEVNKDYHLGLFPNWREADRRREVHIIFGLDDQKNIQSFDELFFNFRRADKELTSGVGLLNRNEWEALIGQYRKMCPPHLFSYYYQEFLDILNPAIGKGAFTSMELIFKPEALGLMRNLSDQEISDVIDQMTNEAIEKLSSTQSVDYSWFGSLEMRSRLDQMRQQGSVADFFSDKKMSAIKEALSSVFRAGAEPEEFESQWEQFKSLREDLIFRDFGSGYLVRLLQKAAAKVANPNLTLRDLFYLRIHIKAEGEPSRLMHIGFYQRPEYTKALIERRDRILNRNYSTHNFRE